MTPTLVFGDTNIGLGLLAARVAGKSGKTAVGHGVDNGVTFGDVEFIESRPLGRRGSDNHDAVIYELLVEGETVRVLAWNVWEGQKPDSVLRNLHVLVDETQPHIIVLCEATFCRSVLGQVTGYRRHQALLGQARSTVVLTRKDIERVHRGFLRMRLSWIGPKHGLRKDPRTYPRLQLRFKSGLELRFLGIHLPTGGPTDPQNGAAVNESLDRIAAWARQ